MKKESVEIKLLSSEAHLSQILTGFCLLSRAKDSGIEICVENCADDHTSARGQFAVVTYKGKKIVYDTEDGYQNSDAIKYLLSNCDFYFKRSYSKEKNQGGDFPSADKRMYPLGFNYHVSCYGHPLDKPYWKECLKRRLHIECNMWSNTYFSSRVFEEIPTYKDSGFRVLFATRLWAPEKGLSRELNEEREYINRMRLDIIRTLRKTDGITFVGGIPDNQFSREVAPELIMPPGMSNRAHYLKLMHTCDICIGSMGLHESIGWKTGEYVAASKAIVNEKMHYSVPGEFLVGKNYLAFATAEECVDAVSKLVSSPQMIYNMKKDNREYYCKYLRPDVLVANTLKIVDSALN